MPAAMQTRPKAGEVMTTMEAEGTGPGDLIRRRSGRLANNTPTIAIASTSASATAKAGKQVAKAKQAKRTAPRHRPRSGRT